ncbi:hypothetical protein BH23GEM8_BH23GEM8_21680 [soil metagenome]
MRRLIGGITVLFTLSFAGTVAAQEQKAKGAAGIRTEVEGIVNRSGVVEALDSLATASRPELERTLEALTATLNIFASRIANDPELRESAVRAAQGLVGVAEVVVVEQSNVLQEALRAAADRIGALPESEGAVPQLR